MTLTAEQILEHTHALSSAQVPDTFCPASTFPDVTYAASWVSTTTGDPIQTIVSTGSNTNGATPVTVVRSAATTPYPQ